MFGASAVATSALTKQDFEWWYPAIGIGFCALNTYALIRTLKSSATICERGLHYKTLRGEGDMLWEEVEKFRYSVLTTYHQGLIKTTQYTMNLVDRDGQWAELGSNLEHPKELAELLLNQLRAILLQKMITAYEMGQAVDLGAIKLSREGILVSMGLRKVQIPWTNVAGCFIENGMLTIAEKVGDKVKNRTVFMRKVDNAIALTEFVNTRIVQRAAAAGR